ncbi:helix-turn-helix transcriptional regulator [Lachnotalea sp. AF33-28]|jgi:AraC family transcriptional regulator of arabinose operon|uniref:helix-turn-helix transcriptional regulator n=1 Tax=Lachnotalea sp. AF33-28 TaxID=2292046 RepID=UPI000E4BB715|nr:AraC family transcriptional regulator [Lachnotalea sp. AF33-28]RHP34924.1 AraC family transcriptional regulator [Lachnotalea sp. AF33-28]
MAKSQVIETKRILHTPSDFAKSTLFYVQEAGRLRSLKSHVSRREHLDSFLFLIVLSGEGAVTYRDRRYHLRAGDCVFIDCKPGYSHQSSEKNPWELMWVHFNGPMAQNYYQYYHATLGGNLFHTAAPAEFTAPIQHLIDMHAGKSTWDEIMASKYITDILTMCVSVPKQQELILDSGIVQKLKLVREYIDEHFQNKISLDELAETCFVSKYHLSREFKRMYGITVGSYILARRITLAKEMLRFTGQSIESIAGACGIPDTSYFNKVFRKSEGMTASEYRRKW